MLRSRWFDATLLALVALLVALPAEAQEGYRTPPAEIVRILDAPADPFVRVSPDGEWVVFAHRKSMPSLADMSQPMLRLAGRRINPATSGMFTQTLITGLSVQSTDGGEERTISVPGSGEIGFPQFAPSGEGFSFTRTDDDGIELWYADLATGEARRLADGLNGTRGGACSWMPDSEHLLCHMVPSNRGAPPEEPRVPVSPVMQETDGVDAPVRTYQDLLENPHHVALYDYYMTSVPTMVSVADGTMRAVGDAAVYVSARPSPSGEYLLVQRIERPYSYLVTERSFPRAIEVWDASGAMVSAVGDMPLGDAVPIGGVIDAPRNFGWFPGELHTVTYTEALDGGDPRAQTDERDRVMLLDAPFNAEARHLATTAFRAFGMVRGEEGTLLLNEYDRPSRTARTWILDVEDGQLRGEPSLLWERNSEDSYNDPGTPVMVLTENGEFLMRQDGDRIYLQGRGASDDGDRPFIDRFDLDSRESERLFRAEVGTYETVVAMLDDDGRHILTRYESKDEPPNYFVRDLRGNDRTAITEFGDPAPELSGVTKQFVTYERADGVQLSGTLYLPAEYEEGTQLPTVVWAYPREYSNPAVAGQVRGSPHRFTRIGGSSHLFFLTQGYAVFDGPTMPIVGGDRANDTYIDQLVSSAQAAVDKVVEMGVADPERIGVGGHSYGAFMTANLLAHSDLFRAGIARSGAYNRTLTPFGFQNERRTFWEASDIYFEMSPFMNAEKINEPMLMIHGVADNNSGTFPIQSQRMYHAIKGLGGTARLVMLPNESHGYRGRESVLHALAEMVEWFDRHVKQAPGRAVSF